MGLGVRANSTATEYRVTFKVTAKTLPEGSKLFITGDQEQLGDWDAGSVPLDEQADGSWMKTFVFAAGSRLEYKITRGTWETEAVDADGAVPGNAVMTVRSNETVNIVVATWKDILHKQTVRKVEGQITGAVKYHRQMEGEGINPRDVIVWLPPSYAKSRRKRYPVLYVQDGQNAFDPATSFTGVTWQLDKNADRLIRDGRMEEILIVGIYNTADRREEYSDSPKGHDYMRFVVKKLKPFVDKQYRTMPGREHTAVMGSSLGGLISFLLAWDYPQVFSQAACLSPAFEHRDIDVVPLVAKYKGRSKNIRLYIDNGGVGVDEQLQPGCEAMMSALQTHGFRIGDNLEWYRDPEAEHNEQAWSKRVWRPLVFFYGVKPAPATGATGTGKERGTRRGAID